MVDSVSILTPRGIFLEPNMFGTLIISYVFLLLIVFVAFINIYSVDKQEFLINKQKCFEIKYKIPFIVMYSKDKHFVSKKTLILELIGYLISIIVVIIFSISLTLEETPAFILLGVCALIVIVFGFVTGYMYGKTKTK